MQFTKPKHTAKHHAQHCFWHKTTCQKQQREARASATQGRPAAACLMSSRRRNAKGLAPDLCHQKHLKSLTGPTIYATQNKRKPNRRPIRKFPTCLAISALTCCLCIFTSLSRAHVLNNPTDHPNNANKTPPYDPIETKETHVRTPEANKGVMEPTEGAPLEKIGRRARADRRSQTNRHIETIETQLRSGISSIERNQLKNIANFQQEDLSN